MKKILILLGLGFCLLVFVFAPLHRYSSIGLYPNGEGGSITHRTCIRDCTDEGGFDYLSPGDWVHGSIEYVDDIGTAR